MFFFEIFINIIHLLRNIVLYIWTMSLHIGHGTVLALTAGKMLATQTLNSVNVFRQELFYFCTELQTTVQEVLTQLEYIRITAIESIELFLSHISNVAKKIVQRAYYSQLEQSFLDIASLINRSLTLISDTIWWIIWLIPRLICSVFSEIAYFVTTGLDKTWNIVFSTTHLLVENIFRITVALFLLFIFWKNLRVLQPLFLELVFKLKRHLQGQMQLVFNFRRDQNQRTGQNSDFPITFPISSPSNQRLEKIRVPEHLNNQQCVVCQDTLKCIVLWPCRHLCLCEECAENLKQTNQQKISCPLCRAEIEFLIPIYT